MLPLEEIDVVLMGCWSVLLKKKKVVVMTKQAWHISTLAFLLHHVVSPSHMHSPYDDTCYDGAQSSRWMEDGLTCM